MTTDPRDPLEHELDDLAAELQQERGLEPAAALDERILAAARAEAADSPNRPVAEAWRTPFAAAASVLLCSVLYLTLPESQPIPASLPPMDLKWPESSEAEPGAPPVAVADQAPARPSVAPPAERRHSAESPMQRPDGVPAQHSMGSAAAQSGTVGAAEAIRKSEPVLRAFSDRATAPGAAAKAPAPVEALRSAPPGVVSATTVEQDLLHALASVLRDPAPNAGAGVSTQEAAPMQEAQPMTPSGPAPRFCPRTAEPTPAPRTLWLLVARGHDASGIGPGVCLPDLRAAEHARLRARWEHLVTEGEVASLLRSRGLAEQYAPARIDAPEAPAN